MWMGVVVLCMGQREHPFEGMNRVGSMEYERARFRNSGNGNVSNVPAMFLL